MGFKLLLSRNDMGFKTRLMCLEPFVDGLRWSLPLSLLFLGRDKSQWSFKLFDSEANMLV